MNSDSESSEIWGDPKIQSVIETIVTTIHKESDRGAVIVACDVIDRQLKILFQDIASKHTSKGKIEGLFDFPGGLSTVSAKIKAARAFGILDNRLCDAIDGLRGLRNTVAHSFEIFSLSDHSDLLGKAMDFSEGSRSAINRIGVEYLVDLAIDSLLSMDVPDGVPNPFATRHDCIEYMSANKDWQIPLNEKQLRTELAIAAILIIASLKVARMNIESTDSVS